MAKATTLTFRLRPWLVRCTSRITKNDMITDAAASTVINKPYWNAENPSRSVTRITKTALVAAPKNEKTPTVSASGRSTGCVHTYESPLPICCRNVPLSGSNWALNEPGNRARNAMVVA